MLKHLLCIMLVALTATLYAQNTPWTEIAESQIPTDKTTQRYIIPTHYRTVRLDLDQLQPVLAQAPARFSAGAAEQQVELTLPMPDSGWGRFRLTESPVMAPALQARFPEIRCYTGVGIDDPTATLKCDLTPHGFHAMIRSERSGTIFIDPYRNNDRSDYIVYRKADYTSKTPFHCEVDGVVYQADPDKLPEPADLQGDCTFRRYRMALACTGEYADFHGGTVPLVLAAMNTTMNRVNGIYEQDFSVTMELIANNDLLVFLDAATDGYSNGSGGAMLGQNQTKCNTVIGSANYDIGHVFSTGGGGVASLGVVCGNSVKARGVTGLSAPVGDPFDVDYVSHEIGHQFGGNHCFNNTCGGNFNPSTAFEPGSGSTIMAYAGVCSPNVQNHSDPYFHAISLQEIGNYITNSQGSVCPVEVNTGNDAPFVAGGGNHIIPKSTPFALTAAAADANGDSLTYCWEQMDAQQAPAPPQSTSTGGPLFRSFNPDPSPSRYFPRLADLVNNNNPTWEELPGVARTLNFRVTVRDNNPAGGCTDEDNVVLTVNGDAGPFLVTEPNTTVTWYVGDAQMVTWDVANTDAAPVNCAEVRILLSTDGGFTYPVVLANSVPNTGSATVDVPDAISETCRVMVQAVGNVFFDISNQNFRIEEPPVPTFLLSLGANDEEQRCTGDSLTFSVSISGIAGFSDPVDLTLDGAPAGASVSIDPNPLMPGNSATVTLTGLITAGIYPLTLTASSGMIERVKTVTLVVLDGSPAAPQLIGPADGAGNLSLAPTLTWGTDPNALQYQIQVADNPSFGAGTLIWDLQVQDTAATVGGLDTASVYYWRVRVENACGQSVFSPTYAFQTGRVVCGFEFESTNVPVNINPNTVSTVLSTLTIPDDRIIADVNISMVVDHTWVGDLLAKLIGPDGSSAQLFDQPGLPATGSGCNGDDLDLTLDDEAALTAMQLENTCGNQPAISGTYQPLESLDRFDNKSAQGVWVLEVSDNFPEDGGSVTAWNLFVCFYDSIPPAQLLVNAPLTVMSGASAALSTTELVLSILSTNPDDGVFVLLSLPQHGELQLNDVPLGIGGSFTQADVLSGLVTYVHNGDGATADSFLFDAVDQSSGGWVHDATFQITILVNDLDVSAALTQALVCYNDSTAQLTVTVTGGTAPFSYSLNGGDPQFSEVFTGLPAGDYTVVVTDQIGFTAETNVVTIDNPAPVVVTATVTDDDIAVAVTGGQMPLEYSLDGQIYQAEALFENLANGTYTVTARDAAGCTGVDTVTIDVPPLSVQLTIEQNVACNGGLDGTITVTVAGGVQPYMYSLDGVDFQPENSFAGLGAGTYSVVVQDDSGNTDTTNTVTLTEPDLLEVSAVVNLNTITASGAGGTGALLYSLDGQNFQSENLFAGLANGTYTVTVQDENGCTATTTATVDVPALEILTLDVNGAILCAGQTVSILVSAGGGIPPYTYSIDGSPFQPDSLFENVGAGDHIVSVMDAAGSLVQSQTFTFSEPDPLVATAVVLGNNVTINTSGGTDPYLYALNGGDLQSENAFEDLPVGPYEVLVVDDNGCTTSLMFTIDYVPMVLTLEAQEPLCAGDPTGSVTYVVLGGMPPYTCTINGNPCSTGSLSAGTYTVVITDAVGETVEAEITLVDPPALAATAMVSQDTITVDASGGTGMLQYSLDGVAYQQSPVFPGVANGTYTVYVQDENGCVLEIPDVVVNYVGVVTPALEWGLVVSPNPSSGLFRLTLLQPPAGVLQATVFNSAGQLLLQQRVTPAGAEASATLDLTPYPPGVYWLRLIHGTKTGMVRLVVQ
ncbi:MAG: T9SS type A sorting domain-containing protein [Bacteroidetes bacterium]|nr:MAG: T9SS type A sorting domain-containing protein [Bacteroidota bacterium]